MAEALAQIERDGFAVIPNVFTIETMDRLVDDVGLRKAHRSRAGVRHAMRIPAVAALARNAPLTEIAQSVLGLNAFPFRATLFDKSYQSNWLVVWHQDTTLPLREKRETAGWGPWSVKDGIQYAHAPASALRYVLALRVHLDDSTSRNGPLRILPGTHNHAVLSDDAIHELANEIAPFDCVVGKGGIVAMRPLLVHASSKSQIDPPRRVLHIEYGASETIGAPLRLAIA
jgi:ectoine hydroxylase-related dioxygenase (phytanoyl-CoA dioxygenase family)